MINNPIIDCRFGGTFIPAEGAPVSVPKPRRRQADLQDCIPAGRLQGAFSFRLV